MPRRIDSNQRQIVEALRKAGASVAILSNVGDGFPDLAVGYKGYNLLLEIKTLDGCLTPAQKIFHSAWLGTIFIVRTIHAALALLIEIDQEIDGGRNATSNSGRAEGVRKDNDSQRAC